MPNPRLRKAKRLFSQPNPSESNKYGAKSGKVKEVMLRVKLRVEMAEAAYLVYASIVYVWILW